MIKSRAKIPSKHRRICFYKSPTPVNASNASSVVRTHDASFVTNTPSSSNKIAAKTNSYQQREPAAHGIRVESKSSGEAHGPVQSGQRREVTPTKSIWAKQQSGPATVTIGGALVDFLGSHELGYAPFKPEADQADSFQYPSRWASGLDGGGIKEEMSTVKTDSIGLRAPHLGRVDHFVSRPWTEDNLRIREMPNTRATAQVSPSDAFSVRVALYRQAISNRPMGYCPPSQMVPAQAGEPVFQLIGDDSMELGEDRIVAPKQSRSQGTRQLRHEAAEQLRRARYFEHQPDNRTNTNTEAEGRGTKSTGTRYGLYGKSRLPQLPDSPGEPPQDKAYYLGPGQKGPGTPLMPTATALWCKDIPAGEGRAVDVAIHPVRREHYHLSSQTKPTATLRPIPPVRWRQLASSPMSARRRQRVMQASPSVQQGVLGTSDANALKQAERPSGDNTGRVVTLHESRLLLAGNIRAGEHRDPGEQGASDSMFDSNVPTHIPEQITPQDEHQAVLHFRTPNRRQSLLNRQAVDAVSSPAKETPDVPEATPGTVRLWQLRGQPKYGQTPQNRLGDEAVTGHGILAGKSRAQAQAQAQQDIEQSGPQNVVSSHDTASERRQNPAITLTQDRRDRRQVRANECADAVELDSDDYKSDTLLVHASASAELILSEQEPESPILGASQPKQAMVRMARPVVESQGNTTGISGARSQNAPRQQSPLRLHNEVQSRPKSRPISEGGRKRDYVPEPEYRYEPSGIDPAARSPSVRRRQRRTSMILVDDPSLPFRPSDDTAPTNEHTELDSHMGRFVPSSMSRTPGRRASAYSTLHMGGGSPGQTDRAGTAVQPIENSALASTRGRGPSRRVSQIGIGSSRADGPGTPRGRHVYGGDSLRPGKFAGMREKGDFGDDASKQDRNKRRFSVVTDLGASGGDLKTPGGGMRRARLKAAMSFLGDFKVGRRRSTGDASVSAKTTLELGADFNTHERIRPPQADGTLLSNIHGPSRRPVTPSKTSSPAAPRRPAPPKQPVRPVAPKPTQSVPSVIQQNSLEPHESLEHELLPCGAVIEDSSAGELPAELVHAPAHAAAPAPASAPLYRAQGTLSAVPRFVAGSSTSRRPRPRSPGAHSTTSSDSGGHASGEDADIAIDLVGMVVSLQVEEAARESKRKRG